MSVPISVPIAWAISQYSNLNHACAFAQTILFLLISSELWQPFSSSWLRKLAQTSIATWAEQIVSNFKKLTFTIKNFLRLRLFIITTFFDNYEKNRQKFWN